MASKEITIICPNGFHIRPASEFAKKVKEYESKTTITYNGETVSAKSALKVTALGLNKGATITLTCEGPDEAKALEELSVYINTLE